jgi:hypothetical protein
MAFVAIASIRVGQILSFRAYLRGSRSARVVRLVEIPREYARNDGLVAGQAT